MYLRLRKKFSVALPVIPVQAGIQGFNELLNTCSPTEIFAESLADMTTLMQLTPFSESI
jgi:hypothetical protein